MTQRIIENHGDMERLLAYLGKQQPPFTVTIKNGGRRTIAQNRLIHLWMGEIAEQLPGSFDSVEHVRGHCKLVFGIPILRNADEHFREVYDRQIKPLPYEQKIACMMEPIAFPVTSRMNTKQLTSYLDEIHREFAQQGVELTIPKDKDIDWQPSPPMEVYERALGVG